MWGSGVGWGGAGIARADALLRPDWPRAASGVLPWLPLSTSGQRLVGRTRVCREEGPVAESRCGSWHASQGGRKAPAGKGLSRAGVVAGRRRFSPVTAPVVASPPRAVTSTPPNGVTAVPRAAADGGSHEGSLLRSPTLALPPSAPALSRCHSVYWCDSRPTMMSPFPELPHITSPCVAQLTSLQSAPQSCHPTGLVRHRGLAQPPLALLTAWLHHVASLCPCAEVCHHPASDTPWVLWHSYATCSGKPACPKAGATHTVSLFCCNPVRL